MSRSPNPTRAMGWALIAATLLTATGFAVGFFADDYFFLLVLDGEKAPSATPMTLYSFAPGDAGEISHFIENGPYPWWTLPELHIRFFRPLSSAALLVDYTVFGKNALPWQIHSLLWYLAVIVACFAVYQQVLPRSIAAIAIVLFAIDDGHWLPAVWVANRNALIVVAPALFGLAAHIRWRETGWKWGLPLSLLGYAASTLGGELWLSVLAYTGAYELFGRRDALHVRARSIAPAAALVMTYLIAYKFTGHGVLGSGAYLDPIASPGDYLRQLPGRCLAMLGGYLLMVPVDAWVLAPRLQLPLAVAGLIGVTLVTWLTLRVWPRLEARERNALRWLVPGALAAMLPVAASFPMHRLMFVPSVGGAALIAILLHAWWRQPAGTFSRPVRLACGALAVIHAVLAPIAWPLHSFGVSSLNRFVSDIVSRAPIDDTTAAQQHFFLIAGREPLSCIYLPIMRAVMGHPLPAAWHAFSSGQGDHLLVRTHENRLELASVDRALVDGDFAELFRSPDFPFRQGDTIPLRDCRITILELRNGKPARIGIEFERPLEDPGYVFLESVNFDVRVLSLPKVGEQRVLRYRE